jgi:hypothetical protein
MNTVNKNIIQKKMFVKTVMVLIFSKDCLRSPNDKDIAKLLAVSENLEFPSMLRSIDCMH